MERNPKAQNMKTGVALYLAVLIGTILIATGLGISTIFYRELRISGLQFPSLTAFYAADTGKECALYHNIQANVFNGLPATITCQGNTISNIIPGTGSDGNGSYIDYEFQFTLSGNRCADIRVKKQDVGGTACTRIDSDGENDDCGGSPTIQRSIVSIDPINCPITSN